MATRAAQDERDLLACPRDGRKYELVDGEIVVSPAGMRHDAVIARIIFRIELFLRDRPLGRLFASSLGVRLPGGNVRSPDVTFISSAKLPPGDLPEEFASVPPDLVVEVLSPGDSLRAIGDKLGEYVAAGVGCVWLVDPRARTVTVYRSLTQTHVVRGEEPVTAPDVLPGFSCPASELFA